jgi:hypothetical protein
MVILLYVPQEENASITTEGSMKLIRIAALLALASLPLLLLKKKSSPAPRVVESEDIFDDLGWG